MDLLDKQLQANLHGDFELGWKIAQKLEKERPDCNRCAFNRGWHLLEHGNLQKGMSLLDRGRWENVFGSPPLNCERQIWRGQDLTNKTVILRNEGGLGDEIINVRFAKHLSNLGAKVIVACSDSLQTIFERIEGVDQVVPNKNLCDIAHDYWLPAMSAAGICGYTYKTLSGKSYLTSNPDYLEKWKSIIQSDKLKVGLKWSGNPQFEHEQHRRFHPRRLFNLHKLDVQLYSFQRDENLYELPNEILDLADLLHSWEDTTAAIECLDLMITSCTSTAHLSAALGKETWVLTPVLPYYIWALPGKISPWYDTVTLFRQQSFGHWSTTLKEIDQALKEKLNDTK